MEIQTALSRTSSFSELLQIAEHAASHLTFFGRAYVSVSGYEGTLTINALAARTLELLKQLNYEFSETDRETGKRLASRIDKIYYDMDELPKNSHCITKIILAFRAIFSFLSGRRSILGQPLIQVARTEWHGPSWWQIGSMLRNRDFEYYTTTQFINRFGFSPEDAPRFGYCANDFQSPPGRWKAPIRIS